MLFEYGDAAWEASFSGVFIPVANLPGATSAEFDGAVDAEIKEGQAVFSLCKQIIKVVTATNFLTTQNSTNKLGVSYTLAETIPGVALKNKAYTFSFSKLIDFSDNTLSVIPVASAGTQSGLGDFSIVDLFSGAAKVASGEDTSGAGILINSSTLASYGALAHASVVLANDARQWLESLLFSIFDGGVTVRATGVESAFPSVPTKTFTTLTIPAAATQTTNPITGIVAADLNKLSAITVSYGVTIQTIENENETISINVA